MTQESERTSGYIWFTSCDFCERLRDSDHRTNTQIEVVLITLIEAEPITLMCMSLVLSDIWLHSIQTVELDGIPTGCFSNDFWECFFTDRKISNLSYHLQKTLIFDGAANSPVYRVSQPEFPINYSPNNLIPIVPPLNDDCQLRSHHSDLSESA
jgi:hypothetical protein